MAERGGGCEERGSDSFIGRVGDGGCLYSFLAIWGFTARKVDRRSMLGANGTCIALLHACHGVIEQGARGLWRHPPSPE